MGKFGLKLRKSKAGICCGFLILRFPFLLQPQNSTGMGNSKGFLRVFPPFCTRRFCFIFPFDFAFFSYFILLLSSRFILLFHYFILLCFPTLFCLIVPIYFAFFFPFILFFPILFRCFSPFSSSVEPGIGSPRAPRFSREFLPEGLGFNPSRILGRLSRERAAELPGSLLAHSLDSGMFPMFLKNS